MNFQNHNNNINNKLKKNELRSIRKFLYRNTAIYKTFLQQKTASCEQTIASYHGKDKLTLRQGVN